MRVSQNPCNPNADVNFRMETFHYEPPAPSAYKKEKNRTAAYCRVSTLMEDQELSFETQCSYYSSLIENTPDMTLVGIYGDEGFSGLSAKKRKEFMRIVSVANLPHSWYNINERLGLWREACRYGRGNAGVQGSIVQFYLWQ